MSDSEYFIYLFLIEMIITIYDRWEQKLKY